MILLLRAAQGSIETLTVVLALAVPAELGVLAELSQRRPVISNGAALLRQTRVRPSLCSSQRGNMRTNTAS